MTKLYNDMLLAADSGQLTALCLLDFTAAFDLGSRPSAAPSGMAVLSPRCRPPVVPLLPLWQVFPCVILQPVIHHCLHCALFASVVGNRSTSFYLLHGGPCRRSQAAPSEHADDIQLYLHCCLADTAAAVTRLEICLDNVSHWTAANRLKLNAEKTELF